LEEGEQQSYSGVGRKALLAANVTALPANINVSQKPELFSIPPRVHEQLLPARSPKVALDAMGGRRGVGSLKAPNAFSRASGIQA
jgi:hypothetical protein